MSGSWNAHKNWNLFWTCSPGHSPNLPIPDTALTIVHYCICWTDSVLSTHIEISKLPVQNTDLRVFSRLRPSSHWTDFGIVWPSWNDAIGHTQYWRRVSHYILVSMNWEIVFAIVSTIISSAQCLTCLNGHMNYSGIPQSNRFLKLGLVLYVGVSLMYTHTLVSIVTQDWGTNRGT